MSHFSVIHRAGAAALLSLAALLSACGGGESAPATTERSSAMVAKKASTATQIPTPTPEFVALVEESGKLNALDMKAAESLAEEPVMAWSARSSGVEKAAASLVPIYRFYNTLTTAHFFTASPDERNNVIANMPSLRFEGIAFYASTKPARGLSPVYRFYNRQTGVHLYTVSETEKANILQSIRAFAYEGIAYHASISNAPDTAGIRRFFVRNRGFHFYSSSPEETANIRATLPNYVDEGPAFYALTNAWTMPPNVDLTGQWLISATGNSADDWTGSVMTFELFQPEGEDFRVWGIVNLIRNGIPADFTERIVGTYSQDGTLNLGTFAVSTKYGVSPKYKAVLNVAGNQMVNGNRKDDPVGSWTATRLP